VSARRRRTPLGTQPPITSEENAAVAGTIETEKVDPKEIEEPKDAPDQEHVVIVQIDDDWLSRLDLPTEQ
jgi:hypothetical protein